MNRVEIVNKRGIRSTFWAEEVEHLPNGWLRARGSFAKWGEDSEGSVTYRKGEPKELSWPPHAIKEVNHG